MPAFDKPHFFMVQDLLCNLVLNELWLPQLEDILESPQVSIVFYVRSLGMNIATGAYENFTIDDYLGSNNYNNQVYKRIDQPMEL